MDHPNDLRRLILLRHLKNRSSVNDDELDKLESLYVIDDRLEEKLKSSLNEELYLHAKFIDARDDGYGGSSFDRVEYYTSEKGLKALNHFIIPSESKEREEKENQRLDEIRKHNSNKRLTVWSIMLPTAAGIISAILTSHIQSHENTQNTKNILEAKAKVDSLSDVVNRLKMVIDSRSPAVYENNTQLMIDVTEPSITAKD